MVSLKETIRSLDGYRIIEKYIPDDHSNPRHLRDYLEKFSSGFPGNLTVLDLGCGAGDSTDLFRSISPRITWHGVDIEGSPEVRKRVRKDHMIKSFNGVDLPYPEKTFDLIYCQQVFEHVRYPDALSQDAFRVMKPGGVFLGSVSYLEPFHSQSIFNFTPYAISRVFGDAGFEVGEIRPESDASMIILRQLSNKSRWLRAVWGHNFLYGLIGAIGKIGGLSHRDRNFLKIQFSGHLCFVARRTLSGK